MECKFISNGIAVWYDQIIKPCCIWKNDDTNKKENHIEIIDFTKWRANLKDSNSKLGTNEWLNNCENCKTIESYGRDGSNRVNSNYSYSHYSDDDITLEIRPGNTCNFACQTCWPEASSKVFNYYKTSGLLTGEQNQNKLDNFDFLLPLSDKIRDVVLLGGEPFYDKSCLKFLAWAETNLSANLTIFTNGSYINWDFIENYKGKLIIVVSLDAIGKAAEYIRYGTIWEEVYANFQKLRQYSNVEVRVNITLSSWNYIDVEPLIELLCQDWPDVVTFGRPSYKYQNEVSIPYNFRDEIKESLNRAISTIDMSDIEQGQKSHAKNALLNIVDNLSIDNYDHNEYNYLKDFAQKMDKVKKISMKDHCKFLFKMLS